MATVNIVPMADILNSPAWTLSAGTNVYSLLATDDSGNPDSDGSKISCTATGKVCVVGLTNEESYREAASIESVQLYVKACVRTRGQTYEINGGLLDGTGSTLYIEVAGTSSSANWNLHEFTERTTSDGSAAWTAGDIDDLRIHVESRALSGGTLLVTYAYVKVTYTPAVSVTYNAPFFGCNF